ncbi:MAG: BON domain-containing protein [Burkholderiales bacterium]
MLASCNRPEAGAQSVEARKLAETTSDEQQQRKPLPDSSLAQIVKSALVSESSLDANKIDVENKAGNVALYGSVETPAQKEKAERIVMSVGGVRSVANNLTVNDDSAARGSTAAGSSTNSK